jgi:hypothetical protein
MTETFVGLKAGTLSKTHQEKEDADDSDRTGRVLR